MANEELNEEIPSAAEDPQPGDPQATESTAEDATESSSEAGEPSIESLQQQLADADKRVLQAEAEKENFRKRIKADFEMQLRFAALPLLQDILQVRDNLKRALEAAGQNESLREGVAMVAKQLDDNLAKHHCKPIPAVGEIFDPNYHEAIQQAPSDEYAAGVVSMEVTTGYQLHERVVRPSQVIVSTGPANS
ncbi:nucleotide exchange factor GrpE [Roseimaritima ulvae]|uniref:Protein GrpE n=1 Tax=Roseimaritima ulvae TaxID=980254 RepID=A0A5B9QVU6_9BACT|nr:nucleotide exchange factor GrpE [Roseimaritima ulvae]QEG41910.1 heat shock protein GrpE [Roseimaritima ulvae]